MPTKEAENYSGGMSAAAIPLIQCRSTFEALTRWRSVALATEEQCVIPFSLK
jgi:hypothetical protein